MKKRVKLMILMTMLVMLFAIPTQAAKAKINKKKAIITVGKTLQLKVKGAKAAKVKWSTSNKKVATVTKKGKVKGKKPGKATITAKFGGKKYKCKVTVTAAPVPANVIPTPVPAAPAIIPVTGISMSEDEKKVEVGTTFTLAAKITPDNATNKAITWSSDNTTVATVDQNGYVVTKSEGVATIWAKAQDGGALCFCVVGAYVDYQKQYDTAPEEIQLAVYGLLKLKEALKNPNSLQVHNYYYGVSANFATPRECVYIDYSAMNELGGYVREFYGCWKDNSGIKRTGSSQKSLSQLYPSGYITLNRNQIETISSGLKLN